MFFWELAHRNAKPKPQNASTADANFEKPPGGLHRYEIVYSGVDEKPEGTDKLLKRMVGERGFEPPTPWSRTRCSTRLSHSPTGLRYQ